MRALVTWAGEEGIEDRLAVGVHHGHHRLARRNHHEHLLLLELHCSKGVLLLLGCGHLLALCSPTVRNLLLSTVLISSLDKCVRRLPI